MTGGARELIPLLVAILFVVAREVLSARRRDRINRALHEARRPLQTIALSLPAGPGRVTPALPVWQAIRALSEVDRQVNGGAPDQFRPEPIACRLMIEACVRRWQSRARMAGGGIELRWTGPDAVVDGDPAVLSAAIENLLVNAIEHGGPRIVVRSLAIGKRLRIEITDRGGVTAAVRHDSKTRRGFRPGPGGGVRHGHGLVVVRRAVRSHGGRFDLDIGDHGGSATIVLPCSTSAARPAPKERCGFLSEAA